MAFLSQALRLGYLLSPHSAFQGHAAHTTGWSVMLSPNGSSDTCISDGVFHIPMPCFHGAPPLAHSAHRALAGRGGTMRGDPAHRHPSPNRVGLAHPTGGATPNTGWGAFDTPPPQAHGMLGVVAHPVPTPGAGINGSRARRDQGERRTPCTHPLGSCRPSPGGHPICASPPPSGCRAWG